MALTPLEIKKQEFKKSFRGYDISEVNAFLEKVSRDYSDLIQELKNSQQKNIEIDIQLREYRQLEKTLQQTLIQAQETSNKSLENSKKEGELIIQEAELKSGKILEDARTEILRRQEEVVILRAKKESITSRLKVLLSSELELINALELDDKQNSDTSLGTGKQYFNINEVLKKLS
ncbi:MAG: DivIVA domain-containing protein [Ignavibacteria bacterium]|nr:DivIVA domain-containing protein [Bacteroidota bacterium]MSQ46325.1 DivIVA domain-containing protein [Ignavibacteria bacterium]